ncbi:MAG: PEP-CTERM sorting domain-containing protein [Burkholderiaceae bacterium]|nr:PEP-CTERM sorting domain-containing protein [Burkholderiaceae bacterium]
MKMFLTLLRIVTLAVLTTMGQGAAATQLTVQHLYPTLDDVQYQASFDVEPEIDLATFHLFAYRNLAVEAFGLGMPMAGGFWFRVEMNGAFTFQDVPGNALRLLDLAGDFYPLAAMYQVTSDIPGWSPDRIGFDADSVTMRFGGLTVNDGDYLSFGVTALPEPGSLALLAVGLAALGVAGKRSQRNGGSVPGK